MLFSINLHSTINTHQRFYCCSLTEFYFIFHKNIYYAELNILYIYAAVTYARR